MAPSVAAPAAALLLLLCSLPAARPAAADGRAMQHMLAFFRQAVDAGVHKGQSYSAAGCPTHSLSCKTALATRSICDEPAPAPLLAGHGVLPVPGLALAGGIAGDVDPALAKYIRVPMHARPAGRFTADLAQSAFTRVSEAGGAARAWLSSGRRCVASCSSQWERQRRLHAGAMPLQEPELWLSSLHPPRPHPPAPLPPPPRSCAGQAGRHPADPPRHRRPLACRHCRIDIPLSGGDVDAPFIAGLFSETAGSLSCESAAFYLTKAMASL